MNTSFWLDNPNVLLNKNQITEIWPQDNFSLDRKLNAITRLILILAILGFLFTKSRYIIVSAAVSIVVLVMIHKSKSHSKEGMKNLDIKINKAFIFILMYVVIFPAIAAYYCWQKAIELIGPNRSSMFIQLMPLFSAVMAIIIFKEKFQFYHFIGATFIISGIYLSNRKTND